MVRTVQSPAADATVYVKLSSLCGSTGSLAACSGAFAVHPGMSLAMKCESIAETITANCATAGYGVTFNSCGSAATFTASNVGCSGTQFALGISDDPDVFDQTGAGALPDGELENICAPSPGPARDLRLEKLDGGSTVRLTWTDGANADSYDVFVDQAAGGNFSAVAGTASSGTVGLNLPMPAQGEFFLVAGSNATCGFSPKR
jgi:hypothetical protein